MPGSNFDGDIPLPLIDGASVHSHAAATVRVINPSNGRSIFQMSAGNDADANRAVAAAKRAFDDGRWSASAPSARKLALLRLADLIGAQASDLDALDAREMGKPVAEKLFNAAGAAGLTRFYAEAIDKCAGDVYASDEHSLVARRSVPRGVVAAVVPWNFPVFNAVLKIAPALAAGNCVVLKPSELASCSAIRLGQLALEAGIPPGVLNVVPGLGETVGRALALHDDVDMIAFTGSTEVGKLMLRYAGQSNMKVVVAECGGKSPQIVFDDGVDLDEIAGSIAGFLLTNQGQICSVGSRVLVQRSIEEALVDRLERRVSDIVMGDALDPRTTFGPVASDKQLARVLGYIEGAQAEGAQRMTGGHRALRDSGGFFVEPTLFRSVAPSSRIAREEVFGPVLCVIPFEDEEEAVRIANDTTYGLMAYVWTVDLSRGMRMAREIRSSVLINAAPPRGEGAGHAASFEPAKQSGLGSEGGIAGMQSYQRRQLVWINHA